MLLLRGSDINATDDNGYTAVHLCAERGYKELLEFLIQNGARVRFTDLRRQNQLNTIADEPLSMALKRGHLDCAEILLKAGADPNAEYFMGHEINLINILDLRSMELLLKYGANPDCRDRTGLTPLMKAARHPQGYATVKLLLDYGADVNDIASERHDHRTVLHFSVFSGHLELVRLLLTHGARYPQLRFDKPSPLDIALISGRADIIKLLIEFDADVNAGSHTTIGQPLHTALTQRIENKHEIVRLLLESGADPNSLRTSNRNSGPILADYLNAARHCGAIVTRPPTGFGAAVTNQPAGADPDMVRMLLVHGARVVLKTASQHPLGIVRTLERIQDELSLDLLCLLIDAAESIDWFMMSKIIYTFLRRANRGQSGELFDPSVLADMTPQRLAALLADQSAYHNGIPDELMKIMNGGKNPSSVLSLKQLSRLMIRGLDRKLLQTHRLNLPETLHKYLLYQN